MTDFPFDQASPLPPGWGYATAGDFRRRRSATFNPSAATDEQYELWSIPSHATGRPEVVSASDIGSNKQHVSPGDVLISRINPRLNRTWVVQDKQGIAQIASTEWVVFPNPQGIDSRFLAALLSDSRVRDFLAANASGIGGSLTRVRPMLFDELRIPVPPLNEQRRIVERIEALFDEIDRGVESLRTARRMIDLYRQSLLKSAFDGHLTADWRAENADKLESLEALTSRIHKERQASYTSALNDWELALGRWHANGGKGAKPPKPKKPTNVTALDDREMEKLPPVPEVWGFNRLGLYITWIQAGKSFKCLESEPAKDQVGVAKVSAVTWGEYDEAESKTCLDENNVNEELFIRDGDFLLSRANTIELVGAVVIAKGVTKRIMLSDKTLRVHFVAKDRRFFLHYLRSPYGRAEIQARSTGNQASMRNIGQDRINSIIVPICSPAEQAEIASILDERFEAVDGLEIEIDASLARTEALRQSILRRAFSGQLLPQDPADEPASAFLARVRAQCAGVSAMGLQTQGAVS